MMTRACRSAGGGVAARPAAVLLEVVLSMGLLVFGMAVVGVQVRSGLEIARTVDLDTRAVLLADTLLAELDAGMVRIDMNDDEVKGNFLNQAPGFTWRIGVKQADIENLYMLTVQIGYHEGHVAAQIEDPLRETSIEDEGTKIVHTLYRLCPKPADIDMERDYGLTPEDMRSLFGEGSGTSEGSGQGDGTGEGDGSSGGQKGTPDLTQLATDLGIDLSQFSFLFEGGSFDPRLLSQLPEDQFMQLAALLSAVFTQGGSALQEFREEGGAEELKKAAKKQAAGESGEGGR